MLPCKIENPASQTVDGWIVRNDGPYGQNRLYCPFCHRHSGLHKPRPFCPWCGKRITGDRDRYFGGYEPKGGMER